MLALKTLSTAGKHRTEHGSRQFPSTKTVNSGPSIKRSAKNERESQNGGSGAPGNSSRNAATSSSQLTFDRRNTPPLAAEISGFTSRGVPTVAQIPATGPDAGIASYSGVRTPAAIIISFISSFDVDTS